MLNNFISVICPVYNEEKYIEDILKFFIAAKPDNKELLVIDGGSADKTKDIIKEYLNKYKNIFLLDNPNRYVSFALNIGIQKSSGNFIIRIDAHTKYSDDYFEKIIETFSCVEADIVGGPYLTIYKNDFQKAAALAISSSFGIGNSKAHKVNYKGYVDSVPYGAYKRELFNEIGNFDERFVRNQDDEFNYRANSLGKKVYLNPEIKLWYYPRSSFKKLVSQYFQYGLYKPLVLSKIKSGIKFRHIIPALFLLYLLSFLLPAFPLWLITPLLIYLLLLFAFSIRGDKLKIKFLLLLIFPLIHISYGAGFLAGLLKLRKLSRKPPVIS